MKKHEYSFINTDTTSTSNPTCDFFSSLTAGAGENPKAAGGSRQTLCGDSPSADNGETKFEQLKMEILAALKANGVDTSAFTLTVNQWIDNDHRDVLWYGGVIAVVEYKGHCFSLEARGEVHATLLDNDGTEVCCSHDKRNQGSFYAEMRKHIANDERLRTMRDDGLLQFGNNNWLEIFVQEPDGNCLTETWLVNDDDIIAGIIEMVETMEEILEDEETADCEIRVFETAIDFARRWGTEEKYLESLKLYRSSAVKRWILLRNTPSDELAALMKRWAKEYLAATAQEPPDGFFTMKLEELYKKEGL